MFGGWGATLLNGGANQSIVHSKAGCLIHTTLPVDGARVIYGTPLDLTIDPGAPEGPRVTITHPPTRLGPQEARRRRTGRSGGGNFGFDGRTCGRPFGS